MPSRGKAERSCQPTIRIVMTCPLNTMMTLPLLALVMIGADFRDDVVLFNGRNLEGWVAEGVSEYVKGGKRQPVWSVEEGRLICHGKGFGFLR